MTNSRLRADFNGLFEKETEMILCLSHSDTCRDEKGEHVRLQAGMVVTVSEVDFDEEVRDDLIATGTVEPSPDWLQCHGSKWILRIDENGVRHESEIKHA